MNHFLTIPLNENGIILDRRCKDELQTVQQRIPNSDINPPQICRAAGEVLRQMRPRGVRLMRQVELCGPSGTADARAYALTADENGQFQQAALGYEAHLESSPADLEATLNLAVLYWQAARFGLSSSHGISPAFLASAGKRLGELLDGAATHPFADRAEVRFWRQYIARTKRREPLEAAACRQMLRERPDYLEPAFVVFSDSSGREAEPEAMRLLVGCAEQPTARSRHVISLINRVLRWHHWRWA
jgi:hypothetical protein